jgi:hypothetical protein
MAAGKQEKSCRTQFRIHRTLGLPSLSGSRGLVHLLGVSRAGLKVAPDGSCPRTFPALCVRPRAASVRASLGDLVNMGEQRTSENLPSTHSGE